MTEMTGKNSIPKMTWMMNKITGITWITKTILYTIYYAWDYQNDWVNWMTGVTGMTRVTRMTRMTGMPGTTRVT